MCESVVEGTVIRPAGGVAHARCILHLVLLTFYCSLEFLELLGAVVSGMSFDGANAVRHGLHEFVSIGDGWVSDMLVFELNSVC